MTDVERTNGSRALERGLRILGLFSDHERSFPVRTISQRLGIPVATTYRLIKTLVELGYLEESPGRSEVQLGLEIVRLASAANVDLQAASSGAMTELGDRTGETVVLLAPGEWTAICIRVIEGTSPIRPRSARVGENVPYNGGATPFALLAFREDGARRRIIAGGFARYTAFTPVDPAEIEQICATVRYRGYALSENEYIEGTAAAAAPIFDSHGGVVASIGITGITERIINMERLVCEAAAQITLRLGGRPVTPVFPPP